MDELLGITGGQRRPPAPIPAVACGRGSAPHPLPVALLPDLRSSFKVRDDSGSAGPGAHAALSSWCSASGSSHRGEPAPNTAVSLVERMRGSALKRHPPDPGRLATALLVGSAKLGSSSAAPSRPSTRGGPRSSSQPSPALPNSTSTSGAPSPALGAFAGGPSSAATPSLKSRSVGRRHGSAARGGAPSAHFERSCCTPPGDDAIAAKTALLEGLLTAGEYEEAFTNGRAPKIASEQRRAAVETVTGLDGFDRAQAAARRQERAEARAIAESEARTEAAATGDPVGDGENRPVRPAISEEEAAMNEFRSRQINRTTSFAPPKVIQLVFRLGTVRNLPCTDALRRIGYPELHERFSVAASATGMVFKPQFLAVLGRYLTAHELADSLRVLDCFSTNAHGDVELSLFLVGLQMLLECATPGDTLRYCFQLLASGNGLPRYMTRFEAQTLITYADESAVLETERVMRRLGKEARLATMSHQERVRACGDRAYLSLRDAICAIVDDPSRYDYCGRMPLDEFLESLEQKVAELAALAEASPDRQLRNGGGGGSVSAARAKRQKSITPTASAKQQLLPPQSQPQPQLPAASPTTVASSPFIFGRAWQGGGALVHRMSSKKMIIASLTPKPAPGGGATSAVGGGAADP